jgi:hypothetical protein
MQGRKVLNSDDDSPYGVEVTGGAQVSFAQTSQRQKMES